MAGIRRSPTHAVAWVSSLLLASTLSLLTGTYADPHAMQGKHSHWLPEVIEPPADSPIVSNTLAVQSFYDRPILIIDANMHTAAINAAGIDSAGRFVVTASDDKTARIWSADDGKLMQTIRVPTGPGNVGKIYAVAISPDGKLVALGGFTSAEQETPIYLFDRETGKMVHRAADGLPNVANCLVFSADGRYLAAVLGGGSGLRIYDRDRNWSETSRDEDYRGSGYGAAFAPDGRLATTSLDGKIRVYDRSFKLIAVIKASRPFPWGVAFNPNGKVIAVGYNDVRPTTADQVEIKPAVEIIDAWCRPTFIIPRTIL
jgi:WD40 repeat protein